jgi:hypothetical protein
MKSSTRSWPSLSMLPASERSIPMRIGSSVDSLTKRLILWAKTYSLSEYAIPGSTSSP